MVKVIAIDGPAASGKSTLSKNLAKKLNITYVNTGSIYRSIAWKALSQGIDLNDDDALSDMLKDTVLKYDVDDEGVYDIQIDGVFPKQAIRTAEISKGASFVSKKPFVRQWALQIQRDAATTQWIVMEGRDIGTVIFPDAKYKFFLTASPLARAQRRFAQGGEIPQGATVESVAAEIAARDKQDSERAVAPLKQAEDAILIDNSDWTQEETLAKIISHIDLNDLKN